MTVITITENNIKCVYGRIKKFFYNKNKTGFEEWHNFDCGFKKHISPKLYTCAGDEKLRKIINIHKYPSPDDIRLVNDGNDWRIVINLTATDGDSLLCGDKIAFCGNRIIYRTKCFWGGHNYVYSVFQALPMNEEEQEEMKVFAKYEAAMYESDYYADCCGL